MGFLDRLRSRFHLSPRRETADDPSLFSAQSDIDLISPADQYIFESIPTIPAAPSESRPVSIHSPSWVPASPYMQPQSDSAPPALIFHELPLPSPTRSTSPSRAHAASLANKRRSRLSGFLRRKSAGSTNPYLDVPIVPPLPAIFLAAASTSDLPSTALRSSPTSDLPDPTTKSLTENDTSSLADIGRELGPFTDKPERELRNGKCDTVGQQASTMHKHAKLNGNTISPNQVQNWRVHAGAVM